MTPSERRNPKTINGSRRKRIANGSGVTPTEVNQLLNQFRQMQKLMRPFALGGKRQDLMRTLAGRG
jgi:signal recognition particle subunit SRP54